jgi:hypothetical protein
VTEALTQLFDDIATHWGAYLAALVALSALTMSLLQVIKDLLFLRLYFQRYQTVRWLYDLSHSQARELLAKDTDRPLENELLRLTSAGHASALYDADLEDFCVQLSAAANFLVDYPTQSPALLRAIARGANTADFDLIVDADEPHHYSSAGPEHRQRVFDARNRIRALTHRSVESFKRLTASRWRRTMHVASFVTSVVISLLALAMSGALRNRPMRVVWTARAAGFLAPVARDLLAAVQQLRRA